MIEAMRRSNFQGRLSVVGDGAEALTFLRRQGSYAQAPRPHLVILDLNLPRMSGRELLATMKSDPAIQHVPVLILTTSEREEDITACYRAHANCYITKPVTLTKFVCVVAAIQEFWVNLVSLPYQIRKTDGQ